MFNTEKGGIRGWLDRFRSPQPNKERSEVPDEEMISDESDEIEVLSDEKTRE